MEPRIQYARTSDGVNITYWTLGEGPALLHPPASLGVGSATGWPQRTRWYEVLTQQLRMVGDGSGLPLHLGIHAGDVIREEGNVSSGAVNIAPRIAGLSAAGEVLVSETVRSLARTSAGLAFEDRGEQELKGVGEKVRVWAVVDVANQQTDRPANQGEA